MTLSGRAFPYSCAAGCGRPSRYRIQGLPQWQSASPSRVNGLWYGDDGCRDTRSTLLRAGQGSTRRTFPSGVAPLTLVSGLCGDADPSTRTMPCRLPGEALGQAFRRPYSWSSFSIVRVKPKTQQCECSEGDPQHHAHHDWKFAEESARNSDREERFSQVRQPFCDEFSFAVSESPHVFIVYQRRQIKGVVK